MREMIRRMDRKEEEEKKKFRNSSSVELAMLHVSLGPEDV
jgi:hypothetical protein